MPSLIKTCVVFYFLILLLNPLSFSQENAFTQDTPNSASSNQPVYGLFDSIADWGSDEFPPKLGKYKVPGKIEISELNSGTVYDIFGNGDDIWSVSDEGIYLYTERAGSWRLSAKVMWIHNGQESYPLFGNRPDASVHIRSHPKLPSSANFRNYLRVGSFGPHFGNCCTGWRRSEGEDTRNWWNQNLNGEYLYEQGSGLYMRVTRVTDMNYFYSEWSFDGINWVIGHGKHLEMPETVAYGLSVTNTADNEMLGHARFSEVKLEPAPPVAKRLVASNTYRPRESIEVAIQIHNNTGLTQSVAINELVPKGWSVLRVDSNAVESEQNLQWNLDLQPGIHQVGYVLRSPDEYNGPASFNGAINGMPVFGAEEIVDSVVSVSSIRSFITMRMLFLTAPVVMFILHITMFLFNMKLREHLYYSFFLLSVTLLIYFLTEETVSMSDIHFEWNRFTFLSSFSLGMLMLFFYTLVYAKLPVQFWLFMGITLFYSIMLNTNDAFYFMGFYNIVFSIGVLECFRVVLIGLKNKLKGFSILALGVFAYGFCWFWIYMNYYIQLPSPGISAVPIAVLFLMFCMSIYLSYWFSNLYQNLSQLTVELEDRVKSRTAELSNINQKLEVTVHELETAKETAENANRAKSNFLARMSHEIRTPLAGLLGMNELLMKTNVNQTQKHYLQAAIKSGETLLSVINEILDVSKIEADKLQLETCPVNIHDVLSGVTESLMVLANQKGIKLSFFYHPDHHEIVLCDPNRVRQVFMNLVGNAIKFTDQGSVTLSVYAQNNENGRVAFLCQVADTGIGIRKEMQAAVFDSFTQGDESTTRKYGGTGLGLAISKRLIELMGGEITVQSDFGKGSTFTVKITFPIVQAGIASNISVSGKGIQPLHAHILLAEDDAVVSKVMTEMLSQLGCTVVHAVNGEEAVNRFKEQSFDIVLLDYHMPVMDGLETVKMMRLIEKDAALPDHQTSQKRLPIIAITANVDIKYKNECIAAGMDDLLCKPFKLNELVMMLNHWLKRDQDSMPLSGFISFDMDEDKSTQDQSVNFNRIFQHYPVLDINVFNSIREINPNDQTIIHEVVTNYKSDTANSLKLLQEGLDTQNHEQIRLTSHKLRSSSAVIGGSRVSQICKQLEENTNADQRKELLDLLQIETAHLLQAINKEI